MTHDWATYERRLISAKGSRTSRTRRKEFVVVWVSAKYSWRTASTPTCTREVPTPKGADWVKAGARRGTERWQIPITAPGPCLTAPATMSCKHGMTWTNVHPATWLNTAKERGRGERIRVWDGVKVLTADIIWVLAHLEGSCRLTKPRVRL